MANAGKKPVTPVTKPYLTGDVLDRNTGKNVLSFIGSLAVMVFLCFIICTMTAFDNEILSIGMNSIIVILVLMLFYNSGAGRGTDAVARGEIMYQRQEKGLSVEAAEKAAGFHKAKGFVNALLGTLPLLLLTLILAIFAQRQYTGIGALPSWMETFQRRTEVGDALVAYTTTSSMSFIDIIRVAVRVVLMPFLSMVGSENKDGLLLLERLSPLIVLLPAVAYGIGYLQGVKVRTQVHTSIFESKKKRLRREKKAQKARRAQRFKEPEQLN